MIPKIENIKDPVIGKYYMVKCIPKQTATKTLFTPIHGSFHNDKEHLNFDHYHYHIDHRFLSKKIIENNNSITKPHLRTFTEVITFHTNTTNRLLSSPYINKPVYKKLKYKRHYLVFPNLQQLESMQNAYEGKCLVNGKCPHKGFDMSTVKADEFGIKYCPLHGLAFKDDICINRNKNFSIY